MSLLFQTSFHICILRPSLIQKKKKKFILEIRNNTALYGTAAHTSDKQHTAVPDQPRHNEKAIGLTYLNVIWYVEQHTRQC